MAGQKIAHATLKGPSVVKEICIGAVLALAAGSLWKMYHWNEQRKVRAFYDLLDKGQISVVAEEECGLPTDMNASHVTLVPNSMQASRMINITKQINFQFKQSLQ